MLEKLWYILNTAPPKMEIPWISLRLALLEDQFLHWLTGRILGLMGWCSELLVHTPLVILQAEQFAVLFRTVAILALSCRVVLLGILGLNILLGRTPVERLMPSIMKMAVFGVILPFIRPTITAFVQIFNSISYNLVRYQPDLDFTVDSSYFLGLLLFTGIYAYLIIRLILYFSYRNFAILALTILSPIILLIWTLDDTGQRLTRWGREIIILLTTQVIHALLLLLLTTVTLSMGQFEYGLFMQLGALLYMNKLPDILAEYVHSVPAIPIMRWWKKSA